MKTAIIGLPMVGKTSLFTILTGVHESSRMGGMEVRVGVAKVPDARLDALAEVFHPEKVTHATIEFLDVPSISKEALREASYLASLRFADAFAHVLRVFESDIVPHEKGSVDPMRDLDDVESELILSDLMQVEKRLERLDKDRKKIKDPKLDKEFEVLQRFKEALDANQPLREVEIDPEEEKLIRGFMFLSQKPILYVLNVGEEDAPRLAELEREYAEKILPGKKHAAVTGVCGKVEAELTQMEPEDAKEFMETYGLQESGLSRMVSASYRLLGRMSFLTAGEPEVRAWTIPIQCKAVNAAGEIHSDLEKKFIRAEVANWKDLVEHGGWSGLRGTALMRLEGKDYIVKDGDVLMIRHG
ncbi:MAG: redox-regulated ATPase YchF [Bryobacterales bacterium]|nr:redox-regulated ATPase YchF [Bryobacterales bacterium]